MLYAKLTGKVLLLAFLNALLYCDKHFLAIEAEEEVVVEVAEEEVALGEEEETTVGEEGTTQEVDSLLRTTFIRKTNLL